MDSERITTSADLSSQLRAWHGFEHQADSYRTQLKCRRRNKGESLAALVQDIRRMVTLAFPGPASTVTDSVACDAFLEALDDPEMALRIREIREREPESLDQAFRVAQRLECYIGAGSVYVYPSDRNDIETKKHCRGIQEAVNGTSEDKLARWLRELESQQQEQHRQFCGELMDAMTSLKGSHAVTAPKNGGSVSKTATDGGQGRTTVRSRRPRRSAVTCYGCGGRGHYRRQCTNTQNTRHVEIGPSGATATNRHIKGQSGLYLRMKIRKKWCLALLDMGSGITLVPCSLVEGMVLETTNQQLQAANGTEIVVRGETTIPVDLGSFRIPLKCLVVEDITEILIGMDWLLENAATMDFKNQRIGIGGRTFGLTKATPDRVVK